MVVLELRSLGLPWPMILLILLVQWTENISHTPLQFSAFFEGEGAQSKALWSLKYVGHAHDLTRGPQFDILSPSGFALAINSCLRLAPGSLAPFGPTCSSWVWLCRSSSGRSYLNPLGCLDKHWVVDGNTMVARCVLLIALVIYRKSTFVLEQPRGSLLWRHPLWMWFVKRTRTYSIGVELGAYGRNQWS